MGAAASIESQDPFVLTAKKSYEQTEKFAAKLVSMAVGNLDEAKMGEMIADMSANDFAAQVTIKLGSTMNYSGTGLEVLQKSGAHFLGSKNEKMEPSNLSVVMDGNGNKTSVLFTHDVGFEGGKMLTGFEIMHTLTWDEEGKITEWSSFWDTQAFEDARPPTDVTAVTATATEAPAEAAPAEAAPATGGEEAPVAEAAPSE